MHWKTQSGDFLWSYHTELLTFEWWVCCCFEMFVHHFWALLSWDAEKSWLARTQWMRNQGVPITVPLIVRMMNPNNYWYIHLVFINESQDPRQSFSGGRNMFFLFSRNLDTWIPYCLRLAKHHFLKVGKTMQFCRSMMQYTKVYITNFFPKQKKPNAISTIKTKSQFRCFTPRGAVHLIVCPETVPPRGLAKTAQRESDVADRLSKEPHRSFCRFFWECVFFSPGGFPGDFFFSKIVCFVFGGFSSEAEVGSVFFWHFKSWKGIQRYFFFRLFFCVCFFPCFLFEYAYPLRLGVEDYARHDERLQSDGFDELYVLRKNAKTHQLKEIWWFQVGLNLLQDQVGCILSTYISLHPAIIGLQFAHFHELLETLRKKFAQFLERERERERDKIHAIFFPDIGAMTEWHTTNLTLQTHGTAHDRCVVQLFHAKHFPDLRLLVMSKKGEVLSKFKLVKWKKVVFEMCLKASIYFEGNLFTEVLSFFEPGHGCQWKVWMNKWYLVWYWWWWTKN